jgi:hypothetical protein
MLLVEIQVIESKKLSFKENLWLKGLSNDLNAAAVGTILEESGKLNLVRIYTRY